MRTDLNRLSTFEMAHKLKWRIGNLRNMASQASGGRLAYHCDLNGETMPATIARKICSAEILRREGVAS